MFATRRANGASLHGTYIHTLDKPQLSCSNYAS